MSVKHPIVSITGSSGAGTTTVKKALEYIFQHQKITPVVVEGDSFHRYDRVAMKKAIADAEARGEHDFSHFGPQANLFGELEGLFKQYGETGTGKKRYYVHSEDEGIALAERDGSEKPYDAGTFTPWEDIPADTDLLFYEGLHGGVVDKEEGVDVGKLVDLFIGVVPSINLEWIQKISRDCGERGYSTEVVTDTILRRMPDYINYIVPQFEHTHINFQRIALVDTSNPFIARDIPTPDESLIVIRFNKFRNDTDYQYLMDMLQGSFMSRPNTLVIPGNKMQFAMELILTPIITKLIADSKA